MSEEAQREIDFPTQEQLETELLYAKFHRGNLRAIKATVSMMIVVAAVAILVATQLFPVLLVYGRSMEPTLEEGNVLIALSTTNVKRGDVVAFYYNNKILIKRVIALPGEWINIDEEGNVYIDDIIQDEKYLKKGAKALGECSITLPYQVPDGKIFVMGDNREVSVDSRNAALGCVSEEQMVGKMELKIWPITGFGPVK